MIKINAISKTLSLNDTGETGGHQAGILIPKQKEILSFFPELRKDEKNPRKSILFTDLLSLKWSFSFIYYNNKFFGGTRNEFRLTGMTKFIKENNLKAGDEITLNRSEEGDYFVQFTKRTPTNDENDDGGFLKLGNSWKIVKIYN